VEAKFSAFSHTCPGIHPTSSIMGNWSLSRG